MCFVVRADFGLEAMERQLIHALCYYADRSGRVPEGQLLCCKAAFQKKWL